jgi:hypothetical protein
MVNPGVHLGIEIHFRVVKFYTYLLKRKFPVHEQRFMNLMLMTVVLSDSLYLP